MDLAHFQPRPRFVRYLANYLALFVGSLAAKLTITGRYHLPDSGPYIIASNHFSIMDPALVLCAVQKPVNFLMASDQVVESLFIWAPWIYGYIPTDRQRLAPSTIKRSLKVLREGEILGIFPEGYTEDTKLRPAKRGALFLARSAKVPIVPVGVEGAEMIMASWKRGYRPRLCIRIGTPYRLSPDAEKRETREFRSRRQRDELMLRIASLLPDKYHGEFAGRPEIKVYRSENRLRDPFVAT
ncbi:MAG: 1-acyl-sn-glycerol-3-phosphate acyltransferase [FCB group bacterium]|nr:1-acyl-sn-glycerol-3-phosphate acyltransferase [FCB group bacterium]